MANFLVEYVKSNDLVSSKYKSSLLENKIMAKSLSCIEMNENDELVAKLYPGDLLKICSDKNHIYRDLKRAAKRLTGHTVVVEDGKGNFKAFSIIPNASYEGGVLTIKFNQELKKHILGMTQNFTQLSLPIVTSFENVNAFRLYELFKSRYYQADKEGNLDLEYNLSELKFIIGIANSDNEGHRNRLANMDKNIDWDYLYAALDKKDKKYGNWNDFKRGVLEPARIEMDAKADLSFEYEEGSKKGKKVITVIFHLHHNIPSIRPTSILPSVDTQEAERQLVIPEDLPDFEEFYNKYEGHNELTKQDLNHLLLQASYSTSVVEAAIQYADRQGEIINNYMGYLVRCIQRRYFENEPVAVVEGSHDIAVEYQEIREASHSDETKKKVWESTKKKEDFEQFLRYAENQGYTRDELDMILEPGDAAKLYIEWVKAHRPEC
jgi:plasmid replication initiation protein